MDDDEERIRRNVGHKKESAARVDGFPYSAYRFARGIGTVVDERVRIIGSSDASRPSAICNYDCKVLTTALCYRLRHVFGVLGQLRSYKADDGQHFPE